MSHILLSVLALPLAACSVSAGSNEDGAPGLPAQGSGGTRTYAVADFTQVELRGADDVDIRVGPGFSVRADGDPDVLDRVKITRDGDTLRIGRVRSDGWTWGGAQARISVTMPSLTGTAVSGSGDMTVDRVEGGRFKGAVAGSGNLNVGELAVGEAEFAVAGSGDVKAAGRANSIRVAVAGSGDVDASGLKSGSARVSISGSGNVRAEVNGDAKVSVVGSGDVDLGSGAKCEVSKMGPGSVRCG